MRAKYRIKLKPAKHFPFIVQERVYGCLWITRHEALLLRHAQSYVAALSQAPELYDKHGKLLSGGDQPTINSSQIDSKTED